MLSQKQIQNFQQKIWDFYKANKRDFPWRQTQDSYKILVSEIMLQQTQTKRVLEKYHEFLEKFPTFQSLAKTTLFDVLSAWQGLGYNRRAQYVKRIAEIICNEYQNKLPDDPKVLETFPGIGHATARSIIVFAFNKPEVFVETNIRRVFIYEFYSSSEGVPSGTPESRSNNETMKQLNNQVSSRQVYTERSQSARTIHDADIFPLIEQTLDKQNPREWYYALIDYGSFLGKTKINPNSKSKHYTRQSKFEGSVRQVRGKILKILLQEKTLAFEDLKGKINADKELFEKAFNQLLEEKFLIQKNNRVEIQELL